VTSLPEAVAQLGISAEDWERTPSAVRVVLVTRVAQLEKEVVELRAKVAALEEKLGQNSRNSSKPPSSDGSNAREQRRRRRKGRKRGGQPGHPRHERRLVPVEQAASVTKVLPGQCEHCDRELSSRDKVIGEPVRHQVTEVPPIEPETNEWQLFARQCSDCDHVTRARLPDGVPTGAFGPRVQALVAGSTGGLHLSRRTVRDMMRDFFNVQISLGAISKIEKKATNVLAVPVAEARAYVEEQPIANIDETGFWQQAKRAFLWVLSTPLVVVFMVHARRAREAANELLAAFKGILVSDRYVVYANRSNRKRQVCWAHLLRAFQTMVERGGRSAKIGKRLLEQTVLLFRWWHRVRDGTMARSTFRNNIAFLRAHVENELAKGTRCRHAKTAGTCVEILKVKDALWTFARIEGVEPTNNEAERALRTAVIWRKTSFGSQSDRGSRFVDRMLTVAGTLRKQRRNLLDYLVQAFSAHINRKPAPSLLPDTQTSTQVAAA